MPITTRYQSTKETNPKANFDKLPRGELEPWGFDPFTKTFIESTLSSPRLENGVFNTLTLEEK